MHHHFCKKPGRGGTRQDPSDGGPSTRLREWVRRKQTGVARSRLPRLCHPSQRKTGAARKRPRSHLTRCQSSWTGGPAGRDAARRLRVVATTGAGIWPRLPGHLDDQRSGRLRGRRTGRHAWPHDDADGPPGPPRARRRRLLGHDGLRHRLDGRGGPLSPDASRHGHSGRLSHLDDLFGVVRNRLDELLGRLSITSATGSSADDSTTGSTSTGAGSSATSCGTCPLSACSSTTTASTTASTVCGSLSRRRRRRRRPPCSCSWSAATTDSEVSSGSPGSTTSTTSGSPSAGASGASTAASTTSADWSPPPLFRRDLRPLACCWGCC